MQRIYGTAFFSDKELKAYLTQIEEAKKRDHRKLGKELGLFTFHPWAPGAAFWQDKGTTLYNTLANYMREVLLPNGYVEVKTPIIFNKALWETSGHWSHYRQNMFQVQGSEGEEMALKAMNCPGHYLLYASEVHSYRELPIRFHEQTPLHRNELAGVLSGLTRVRQFSQDDGHCFVMPEQIGEEVERLLKLVRRVYGDLGMTFQPKLATRPDEYLGETVHLGSGRSAAQGRARQGRRDLHDRRGRRQFLRAEDRLRRHRRDRPEVAVRDDPARLPDAGAVRPEVRRRRQRRASRGGDPPGDFRQLRAVHRDSDRALRRARSRCGSRRCRRSCCRFPTGISSTRPRVRDRLKAAGLRAELDDRQEKIGYKIREAQLQKVPYMLVVGDRESADGTVSVRTRKGGDQGSQALELFIDRALAEVRERVVDTAQDRRPLAKTEA